MATATVIVREERDKREEAAGYRPLLGEPPPMPTGETMPTPANWHRHRLLGAGVSTCKAIMGVAVLALPRIMSQIGMGTALLWIVFVALLTLSSLWMLTAASARTGLLSFSDVMHQELGTGGQVLADIALIANNFGMMVIGLIVLGDILAGGGGAPGLLSPECGDRRTVLAVICLMLLLPLTMPRTPRAVSGVSALGVAAIVLWALISLLFFLIALSNGQLHRMAWWPTSKTFTSKGFESAVQMVAILPVLLLAFLCQNTFQHTLQDLGYLREHQIRNVAIVALALSAATYLVISVTSYGLFGRKEIEADVLQNFTVEALEPFLPPFLARAGFTAVRLGFVISLVATFQLQMGPFRDSLWKLLFRQDLLAASPGYYLVTAATLAAAYAVSAYVRNIWQPLLLLGSTAGVLIALVFPGWLGLAMREDLAESPGAVRSRRAGGAALILVGLVIGVAGLLRFSLYKDPVAG